MFSLLKAKHIGQERGSFSLRACQLFKKIAWSISKQFDFSLSRDTISFKFQYPIQTIQWYSVSLVIRQAILAYLRKIISSSTPRANPWGWSP